MRVAVIGSRSITAVNLQKYLPQGTTQIVSGGARGVDTCARNYARAAGIPLVEYLPDYARYGKSAPLRRNITIIQNADVVLAFWDGQSHGTRFVIDKCKALGVPCRVFVPKRP